MDKKLWSASKFEDTFYPASLCVTSSRIGPYCVCEWLFFVKVFWVQTHMYSSMHFLWVGQRWYLCSGADLSMQQSLYLPIGLWVLFFSCAIQGQYLDLLWCDTFRHWAYYVEGCRKYCFQVVHDGECTVFWHTGTVGLDVSTVILAVLPAMGADASVWAFVKL